MSLSPHYHSTQKNIGTNRYYFKSDGEETLIAFNKCTEILVEKIEFHEMLKKFNIKVILNSDFSITFEIINKSIERGSDSDLSKLSWDTLEFRSVFDDYGLQLIDLETGEKVE